MSAFHPLLTFDQFKNLIVARLRLEPVERHNQRKIQEQAWLCGSVFL